MSSLPHYGPWTRHIRPRVQNYLHFAFYQHVEQVLLSLQVNKMQRIIKGLHNVSSEFCRFLEGGLATLSFIFSVISYSILKISVPIWLQISWIFQNTPNFCILDEFEGSYCRFSTKGHFFRHPVYKWKISSLKKGCLKFGQCREWKASIKKKFWHLSQL